MTFSVLVSKFFSVLFQQDRSALQNRNSFNAVE